jgi:hypothetical protein
MSAIKSKQESKIILNFSDKKLSKKYINDCLKQVEIISSYYCDKLDHLVFRDNDILIGMYKIRLSLLDIFSNNQNNQFKITIFERTAQGDKEISLSRDLRFKCSNWIQSNNNYKLKTKNLVDAIYLCNKLDNLKLYL